MSAHEQSRRLEAITITGFIGFSAGCVGPTGAQGEPFSRFVMQLPCLRRRKSVAPPACNGPQAEAWGDRARLISIRMTRKPTPGEGIARNSEPINAGHTTL